MLAGPMTPAEVEQEMGAVLEHLERLTEEYARQCHASAEAESDYRIAFYRAYLVIKANGVKSTTTGEVRKVTEKEAEAHATTRAEDLFRSYKITAASAEATKEALRTHRTRLDALRTVAANARGNAS